MISKSPLYKLCKDNHQGSYGIPAAGEEYSPGATRYLRISDISDDGNLLNTDKKYVSGDDVDKYLLSEGDIVFARTGNSTGRSYYHFEKNGELVYAGFLIKYSLNPKKINPIYVKYYALSENYKKWVDNTSLGSTRGNLNAKSFANCIIQYPERKQQDLLAHLLSTLDAKIHLNNQINAELEKLAKTIYDYWFVQFDFPDAQGRPYKSSGGEMVYDARLGREIPVGWGAGMLGDVIKLNYGKPLKKDIRSNTGYPVVGSGGIVGLHDSPIVAGPGIVVGRKGTVGSITYLHDDFYPIDTAYFIEPLVSNQMIYSKFLLESLQLHTMNSDSAVPGLNRDRALSVNVILPAKHLIDLFNDKLLPFFATLKTNQQENAHLTSLRDWLLPLLMNGQVGVRE